MSALRGFWTNVVGPAPGVLDAQTQDSDTAVALQDEPETPSLAGGQGSARPIGSPAPAPAPGGANGTPGRTPAANPKSPTITITTASGATQLLAGSSERFKATLTLPNGSTKNVTDAVTWDPPELSISAMGYTDVKVAAGSVTITATHAATGATGSITVMVVTRILRKIIISPKNPMFEVDKFEPLNAQGEFSDNTTEDLTDRVIWESREEKVATMSSLGHCHTKAPGKADIWAFDRDTAVIGTTKVTVHAAGKAPKLVRIHVTPIDPKVTDFAPLQFTAMGDFADNSSHEVTDRVRWVTTKPDTLAINERSGLATPGLVADIAWITAVDDATGKYGRSEATVEVPKLESIAIAPRNPSLPRGNSVPVSVMGAFSVGPPTDVTNRVAWSTNNRPVAAVLPVLNEIFGASEGTAEIGATVPNFPDVGDSINVTVLPAVVTSIEIAPGDTTLQINGTQTFAATAIFSDARREVLTGKDVRWSSDDEKAVIIDQKGEATAKGPGTATITATHRASRRSESIIVTVP